jgi:very-short-patch-repair endonuclease
MKKYIKPTSPKKARNSQPSKDEPPKPRKIKTVSNDKPIKQKVFKSQKISPVKGSTIKGSVIRRNDTPKERKRPEYGTSDLETKFAKKFLDRLKVEYITQFKAESIKRYYDFYIPSANLIIEIDGSYWHSDPRLLEGKELTPTQKRNKRVDKDKDKWAVEHKIPLLRIWEYDINHNPEDVMKMLTEKVAYYTDKHNKEIEKKKRPLIK